MEDDRNNLIPNHETSLYTGFVAEPQRRSFFKGAACPTFSILMALLFAGQAVTVYFVYQHNNQISKLTTNTQQLKLQSLANTLPHNSKSGNGMKLSMANMMPLAMRDTESLEEEMKLTNTTEDQVKRLLLLENPSRKFPDLKSNFRENMNQMRKRMTYEDWKSFETWMHKWLLFQLAQNEVPEEKVKTKCQEEASVKGVKPGRFRPQCDENGDYLPKQCDYSTGFCWCVYKNGTMVEGTTKVRGPLDCTGKVGTLAPQTVTPTEVNLM